MENRENGRMILNSVQNGPLVWPIVVQEDDTTMTKKYEELSVTEKLQAEFAKEIWDRVKLLMQGTKLSLQERECKLYDEFDKFSFVKGETLYQYYWRFAQLINNMNVINMSMRPVQVNTKFLNSLPPEWSKFVTDVKLARDLHTTNYDQLYSYLEQHEAHANETRLMRERYQDPLAFVANFNQPPSHITNYHSQYNATQFPQQTNTMIPQVHSPQSYSPMYAAPHLSQPQITHSSVLPSHQYQSQMDHQTSYVLLFLCLLKEMIQLPVSTSQWPLFKTVGLLCDNFKGDKDKVMLPKRPRNAAWFKDKAMLAEAHESGQILDEEQLAFLADPGILDSQAAQTTIPNTAAFQTKDLDSYDSDCDDISNAKAVLMANLSNYGLDVISKVPHFEPYHNDMDNQSVKVMQSFEQTPVVDFI
ncbi:hypothetical protein Tco_0684205, partial [Tanacetum coccineum]